METKSLISLLRQRRNLQRKAHQESEKEQNSEYAALFKQLQDLQDETARIRGSIVKNLTALVAHKHAIHKAVQNSDNVPGLPISHKCQQKAVNFVSDAITFINDLDASNMFRPEKDIDIDKLCSDMKTCGEFVSNELNRAKNHIEQIETLNENIDIIKDQLQHSTDEHNDDDAVFHDSVFEE